MFELIRRGLLVQIDARHARPARSLAEPGAERVDGGGRAAGLHLDLSVGQVTDPAVDAQASRLLRGRGAKPDALHPASHHGTHLLQG
jgi:hypothetical protein